MASAFANAEQARKVLDAQAHVWSHIVSFLNALSMKCAVQLKIPDIIHAHGRPMTLHELVEALHITPTKAHFVHRMMEMLIRSGYFEERTLVDVVNSAESVENGGQSLTSYVLSPEGELLLTDHPLSLVPSVLSLADESQVGPWHHFSAWLVNDDATAFETKYGMPFWEYTRREPKVNKVFNDGMASDARLVSSLLISNELKGMFEGIDSLVDVGGGTGNIAKAIADAFPHMDCTVFDLPHVVANMEGSGNLKYVGGNMFEAIPQADAILLKWILHNWNDEDCSKILRRCKESISGKGKKGKVIIIEMVTGNRKHKDERWIDTEIATDMWMMAGHGGKERTEKEWAKLFRDAGFADYKINTLLGSRSVIEVYP